MQLTLDNKFCAYIPPRTQLLKWVGNKQKFAVEITKFFPKDFNYYYEPFLGSGAILATISPTKGLGSDIYKPLMEIWKTLKKNPKELIEWYSERRNLIGKEKKEIVYEKVKESFNCRKVGEVSLIHKADQVIVYEVLD